MADLAPTDPEEVWQQYLSSLPDSFSSLVNTDLHVGEATLPVHQDLLCLHSEILSDMLASCSKKDSDPRRTVPLQDDNPDDAVRYLKLLYQQTRKDDSSSVKLSSASQTVRIARFAHKYAASLQSEACDEFLYTKAGDSFAGDEPIENWGPIQWIEFAERHDLSKTLAAWECWAIKNFKDLKEDILGTPNTISFRSLARICRGLHETSGTSGSANAIKEFSNCRRGCNSDDISLCNQCGTCKICSSGCSTLSNGRRGCPTHNADVYLSDGQGADASSLTMETLMSWQS